MVDLYIHFYEDVNARDKLSYDEESMKYSFEDKKAERKAGLRTSKEHIGEYDLSVLQYKESANFSHSSGERIKRYYYNNGKALWTFEFAGEKENEMNEVIKAFFESLKFGEAQ